ncbi:Hypothetical Protein CGB_A0430C [Cryptococcus gattii WM276]|uniref:Uncharacterized protein n=1 Tax=Cryptococcus gattii serotype B (strain WM276 / ATCC MYA-4071) TaxID=367775 RepID=E6QYZ6_CRYGW|nr:Hypothetical Protein CGB_A0430C [Cryptococcus gattii WM276]ADV19353.1 Hypothetical Protein CGB_A0430C [Cryptococcus gattii WM276]KJE05185.1 hypothetical protein I311_00861 [Cryptococcus gattii NT-10]
MSDLLELEPPPSGEELDRYYSKALNRLWHPEFLWEACYTVELGWNLERCVRTRTLDPPNLPVYVAIDLVPELSLSLVLSTTRRGSDAPIMLLKLDASTLMAGNPHPSPSPSKSKLFL